MVVRKGKAESDLYTLSAADAIEALLQHIESVIRRKIPRSGNASLSLSTEKSEVMISLPREVNEFEEVGTKPTKRLVH